MNKDNLMLQMLMGQGGSMSEEYEITEYPLVSAVITTHNRRSLLLNAIESVKKQTYPNIEVIVVDDASTDGTKAVLEMKAPLEEFKYIYIPKEESKGGNHARNIGIMESKGKYVAFLDDDDEWLPDKINKQVTLLEQNLSCGICYCGMIRDYDFGKLRVETNINQMAEGDLSKEILVRIICNTSTIMADRDLLLEAGLFDEKLRYWQEYELCIRLFQLTYVIALRENLVLYRVITKNGRQLSNNIEGWEAAVAYIYEKHEDKMRKLNSKDINRRDFYHYKDGANRSSACRNKALRKKYLWKVFFVTHRPKHFVKAFFNISASKSDLEAYVKARINGKHSSSGSTAGG